MIIPEELWPDIEDRPSSRLVGDPWEDVLVNLEARGEIADNIVKATDDDGKLQWRVRSNYILMSVLGIPSERVNATPVSARSCANSDGVVRSIKGSGRSRAKGTFKPVFSRLRSVRKALLVPYGSREKLKCRPFVPSTYVTLYISVYLGLMPTFPAKTRLAKGFFFPACHLAVPSGRRSTQRPKAQLPPRRTGLADEFQS